MPKPGLSVTLGVSQNSHNPYCRIAGRMFGFTTSRQVNMDSPLETLAAVGIGLLAGSKAVQKKAGKKKKAEPVSAAEGSALENFINPV